MITFETIHSRYVHGRRHRILSHHIADLIPRDYRILDVGSGDGVIAQSIASVRPDIAFQGIDVLMRAGVHIPTQRYDGKTIPYSDASFDGVMFIDVLHHSDDPMTLLREAKRVARYTIIIKDHLVSGLFARQTLQFMDRVGNARFGVALPFNYWSKTRWLEAFDTLELTVGKWSTKLGLYPPPARWIFERSLHFVARLDLARKSNEGDHEPDTRAIPPYAGEKT